MTITEANATNILLEWILSGRSSTTGEVIADADALNAAKALIAPAYKALYAGMDTGRLHRRWSRRRFRGARDKREKLE